VGYGCTTQLELFDSVQVHAHVPLHVELVPGQLQQSFAPRVCGVGVFVGV
jgi:hypothetical protein